MSNDVKMKNPLEKSVARNPKEAGSARIIGRGKPNLKIPPGIINNDKSTNNESKVANTHIEISNDENLTTKNKEWQNLLKNIEINNDEETKKDIVSSWDWVDIQSMIMHGSNEMYLNFYNTVISTVDMTIKENGLDSINNNTLALYKFAKKEKEKLE